MHIELVICAIVHFSFVHGNARLVTYVVRSEESYGEVLGDKSAMYIRVTLH